MVIAITGSTGMVGEALVAYLRRQGHIVSRIVRGESEFKDPSPVIRWDIASGMVESDKLEGVDVIIHLSGAPIAGKRWSKEYKKAIRDSRVKSTKLLAKTIKEMNQKPRLFISASAMGYYGVTEDSPVVDENASSGQDFLSNVCRQWEHAAQPVIDAGVRTVFLRIGVVLGNQGGALQQMLPIFKKGLGGPIASGKQKMSWVHVDEFGPIVQFLLERQQIEGPVNLCSPQVVTNKEFTQVLGQVLKRPAFLPVPAFVLRLIYGDMADALLVKGVHMKPSKLLDAGYGFQYIDLKDSLKDLV